MDLRFQPLFIFTIGLINAMLSNSHGKAVIRLKNELNSPIKFYQLSQYGSIIQIVKINEKSHQLFVYNFSSQSKAYKTKFLIESGDRKASIKMTLRTGIYEFDIAESVVKVERRKLGGFYGQYYILLDNFSFGWGSHIDYNQGINQRQFDDVPFVATQGIHYDPSLVRSITFKSPHIESRVGLQQIPKIESVIIPENYRIKSIDLKLTWQSNQSYPMAMVELLAFRGNYFVAEWEPYCSRLSN